MSTVYGPLDVTRRSGLLFDFQARDLSLTARTGQVGVFGRNDTQSVGVIDANGVYGPALPNQPRFIAIDTDGDGVRDAVALLLEPATTNLVEQNCTVGTSPWTFSGTTPTNAALSLAGLSWCLFTSASTSAARQTIGTFATAGGKAYSFRIKAAPNTTGFVTGDVWILPVFDDTDAVARAAVKATVAADGSITFTSSVGTIISAVRIGGGAYEVKGQSTTVTAAHTHAIYANDGLGFGGTATAYYATGFQVEDRSDPTSLIVTAGATGSRLADTLHFPFNAPPQAMTVYVKGIVRLTDFTGDPYFLDIGTQGGAAPHFFVYTAGDVGEVHAEIHNTAATSSAVLPGQGFGDTIEAVGILNADGSVSVAGCKNGGTILTGGASASQAMPSAWSSPILQLGWGDGGAIMAFAYQSVRVAAGVVPLNLMRATA